MATSTVVLLSDSTNAWFVSAATPTAYLVESLYDTFGATIRYAECSTLTGSYNALATTKYGGIGADEILLYDGSVGGQGISDYDDPTVLAARVTAVSPDIVLIALGINGATGTGTADLISSVKGVAPSATIIVIAQNPSTGEGEDSTRRDTIQTDAASESVTFVDVWQAFINYGDWENDLLADTVHPTTAGYQIYANVAGPTIGSAVSLTPQGSPVGILDSAQLVLRAGRYSGSGNWLDESGNGHNAVPSGSPAFDGTKFTLDGSSDFFTVTSSSDLEPGSGSFTVVAVIAPSSSHPEAASRIVQKRYANTNVWGLDYLGDTDRATGYFHDGTNARQVSAPTDSVPEGALSVVSVRHVNDSDYQRIGYNGTYGNGGGSLGTVTNAYDLTIGAWSTNSTGRFMGDIYGVAIWTTSLSDAEVEAAGVALQASGKKRLTTLFAPLARW